MLKKVAAICDPLESCLQCNTIYTDLHAQYRIVVIYLRNCSLTNSEIKRFDLRGNISAKQMNQKMFFFQIIL